MILAVPDSYIAKIELFIKILYLADKNRKLKPKIDKKMLSEDIF